MILLKTEKEISLMKKAGDKVSKILMEMANMIEPGMSTGEIDKFAEARCRDLNCTPAFKGYKGFPASVCISINEEAIHGIPSFQRIIKPGDIVGLDFGVIYNGWYGDAAVTVPIEPIDWKIDELLVVTNESLVFGIEQCQPGNRLGDIGHAIQAHAESNGFGVVRNFSGHGIGRSLHEEPEVLNYGNKDEGLLLRVGMVLAIEPMLTMGHHKVKVLDDGWTVVTEDGSLAAHFEQTVAITPDGPLVLTRF